MRYNPQRIEKKWQKIWEEKRLYKTKDIPQKPKFYVLDMFPYPSGAGLHVGHLRGYIATDVIARMKMMQGYNVLHPMGWDAFGLPAENYAISHKIHPAVAIKQNIKNFKRQLEKIGFTYDWSREINTTDPNYYKWTQWIFLQFFKKGLVFESFEPINWCPSCKTGLANEDLEQGKCERCGSRVEKKPLRQWVIKITKYAERLLKDLKYLEKGWPEHIIKIQKDWIGKSEGVEFKLKIVDCKLQIVGEVKVFTTRIDTVFGMTYVVLAPEHPLIEDLKLKIANWKEVEKYKKEVESKLAEEREKEKTGVKLEGILAENPFNKEKIPIFISEYVLADYATGSIMAVPAHDERDFEFAKKFGLPIRKVIEGGQKEEECFEGEGVLVNSGEFSGLSSAEAKEKMILWLRERKIGKKMVYYKIRDWVFARQRYWGEPFPLIFCENCKKKILKEKYKKGEFNKGELSNPGWICIPEKDLPVLLPKVKYYEPTGTGQSPLAKIEKWVKAKCPKCGGLAERETNTMPQWAGSCWYYLRYIDPKNDKEFCSLKKEKYWMPVDLYVGGAEHATRHLIYARFWYKFLYDIGEVSNKEPFLKLKSVGVILGADGRKMSKRYGNVINPDDVCKKYGADALRIYEMFMGPFDQRISWQERGIVGAKRFLERVWNLRFKIVDCKLRNKKLTRLLHQTIKKVTQDIENFKFNTAISQLMVLTNEMEKEEKIGKEIFKNFLKLLAPFTPHISEEIWFSFAKTSENKQYKKSIFLSSWPKYNPRLAKEEMITLVVQINGKVRDKIEIEASISEKKAKEIALSREKVQKWIEGKEIKKIIFVPGKLINIVV
jgi:leucyl-tRNA synthetase